MNRDRQRLRLTIVSLLGVVLAAGPGFTQTGSIANSPAEVVKKFLSLDARGARLDGMSFDAIVPYIGWKDEPAWGHVVVIESYVVPEQLKQWEIVNMLEVVIPVEFRVLGAVYFETASFIPEITTEQVRVRVRAVKNRWRIVEPILPPHVGHKRMLNFVREAILQESDAGRRARLTALRDEMRKVK